MGGCPTKVSRGPWKHIFMDSSGNSSGFLGDPLGSPGNPMGFHGFLIKFHGIPSDSWGIQVGSSVIPMGIPTFPTGIQLFSGGGKSGKKMFFLAHPPLGDPPGPLGGSFQRGSQNTPISILKLPFEHLSSWGSPDIFMKKLGSTPCPRWGGWGVACGPRPSSSCLNRACGV